MDPSAQTVEGGHHRASCWKECLGRESAVARRPGRSCKVSPGLRKPFGCFCPRRQIEWWGPPCGPSHTLTFCGRQLHLPPMPSRQEDPLNLHQKCHSRGSRDLPLSMREVLTARSPTLAMKAFLKFCGFLFCFEISKQL